MHAKAKSQFVLASASPARLELLKSINLVPDSVSPADIDETPQKNELPKDYVMRIAAAKAETVSKKFPQAFVVAADTIGVAGRAIIGKAENEIESRKILNMLSGRRHRVLTGLCIISPEGIMRVKVIQTTVKFKRLEKNELDEYIKSGQWKGKSGCYGIQSMAGGFIEWINGSFSNVVGLPLVETRNMLKGLGFK